MTKNRYAYWSEYLAGLKQKGVDEALSSVFFKSAPLNRWLRRTFEAQGRPYSLMADPVFESMFPWESSRRTLRQMVRDGLFSDETMTLLNQKAEEGFPPDRKPFRLQYESFQWLLDESKCNSLIVSSGTGSGKTECFMMPMLEDLVREFKRGEKYRKGIRALLLYPLNALSDSQRDRLRCWTHDCPEEKRIRFVIYNGETDEKKTAAAKKFNLEAHPEEVFDRETMREVVPQIMLTNPSMLERMLLRKQDAGMVAKTRSAKCFRWIILDEAHTYLGSKAANLALLLRRTINAFGVDPRDVHFVATSATVNADDEVARERLRKFVMDVSGTSADRVHLVLGRREVPEPVRTDLLEDDVTPDELEKLSEPELEAALMKSRKAMTVRNVFLTGPGYASLSDVAKAAGIERDEALRWIDLVTGVLPDDKTGRKALLPLRLHQYFNTTGTLGACVDPQCPHKDEELCDKEWHFGKVWLDERRICTCGAPVLPIVACKSCNSVVLKADYVTSSAGESLEYPGDAEDSEKLWKVVTAAGLNDVGIDMSEGGEEENSAGNKENDSAESDEFEDPDYPDGGVDDDAERWSEPVLVTNDEQGVLAQSMLLTVPSQENADDVREITVHFIFGDVDEREKVCCPTCGEKARWAQFYLRQVSSRYVQSLMPYLLEHCSTDKDVAELPKHGRKLLTFADSRQGTAKIGALLEREGERSFTIATLYRQLLETAGKSLSAAERTSYEMLLKTPDLPATIREDFERKLQAGKPEISWREVHESIRQEIATDDGTAKPTRHLTEAFWLHKKITPAQADDTAQILLLREFLYRPKNGATLETCGLVSVVYPELANVEQTPAEWPARFGLEGWRKYLKLVVDFVVRARYAVHLPQWWAARGGNRFVVGKTYLAPCTEEKAGARQLRWPAVNPKNSARSADFVKYTGSLLGINLDNDAEMTDDRRNVVNTILKEAFTVLRARRLLTPAGAEGAGYALDTSCISLRLNKSVWAFKESNKLYDTLIGRPEEAVCPQNTRWSGATEVTLPEVNVDPFLWQDAYRTARQEVQTQLAQSKSFRDLVDNGYWNRYGTMALERTGYYAAAEHTAQLSKETRVDYVNEFKKGLINVLSCSTTMEMGVDLAAINTVVMMTVPPYPANYMQRAGRAGRRKETRSNALVVAGSSPRDQEVFSNPKWALEGAKPNLIVSLDSRRIVQRHVNAQLLSAFFATIDEKDGDKLTREKWCDQTGLDYLRWLSSLCDDDVGADLKRALERVTRFSVLAEESVASMAADSHNEMMAHIKSWKDEMHRYNFLIADVKDEIGKKALTHQLKRFKDEKIYEALTEALYLPSTVRIINVTPFNYRTLQQEANEKYEHGSRHELPSRPAHIGIHEYAPGVSVVIDGAVYESGGLTLNWKSPASVEGVSEIQQIEHVMSCDCCGQQFLASQASKGAACPNCGTWIMAASSRYAIKPSGFCVPGNYVPNNDYTLLKHYPRKEATVFIEGESRSFGNGDMLRIKSSSMARVLSMNEGNGIGFAVCLNCGWAKPEVSADECELDETYYQHSPLRISQHGVNETGKCLGGLSGHDFQMKHNLVLAAEITTDALEVVFNGACGLFGGDKERIESAGLGIGIALRRGVAERLGIEEDEIGIAVALKRSLKTGDLIVNLYDHNMGGYSSRLEPMMGELLVRAREVLICRRNCSTVCGACLLTFDTRHVMRDLNRFDALKVLTHDLLRSLNVPTNLAAMAGRGARYLNARITDYLRSMADVVEKVQFVVGERPEIEESLMGSELYGIVDYAQTLFGNVEMIAIGFDWGALEHEQQNELHWLFNKGVAFTQSAVDRLNGADLKNILILVRTMDGCRALAVEDAVKCRWNPSQSERPILIGELDGMLESRTGGQPQRRMMQIDSNRHDATVVTEEVFESEGLCVGNFGERVLEAVSRRFGNADVSALFEGRIVRQVSYTDRYLMRYIDLPLVLSLFKGLRKVATVAENAAFNIRTLQFKEEDRRSRWNPNYSAHWESEEERDEIARDVRALCFRNHGLSFAVDSETVSTRGIPHPRRLIVTFKDGSSLLIGFDQGVGFVTPSSQWPVGASRQRAENLYRLVNDAGASDAGRLTVKFGVQIYAYWQSA